MYETEGSSKTISILKQKSNSLDFYDNLVNISSEEEEEEDSKSNKTHQTDNNDQKSSGDLSEQNKNNKLTKFTCISKQSFRIFIFKIKIVIEDETSRSVPTLVNFDENGFLDHIINQ